MSPSEDNFTFSAPPEILDAIAEELYYSYPVDDRDERKDCSACSLVCKAFHASFRPFVFHRLLVRDIQRWRRFAALLQEKPGIGAHVRELDIHPYTNDGRWSDWEGDFVAIARKLSNIQEFRILVDTENLNDHHDDVRAAILTILNSPFIRSVALGCDFAYAIPPRLLPSLEEMHVFEGKHTPNNELYWETLDAAYLNLCDSSAINSPVIGLQRCQKLQYLFTTGACEWNWLSYTLATQPTYLAHLTSLGMRTVTPNNIHLVQSLLTLTGAGLQHLDLRSRSRGQQDVAPPNLSHNTGLQSIVLYYKLGAVDIDNFVLGSIPSDGLAAVGDVLSTVNAPSLGSVLLDLQWKCPPNEGHPQSSPEAHLRRLDGYLSDFSKRHPCFEVLSLNISVRHLSGCSVNDECDWYLTEQSVIDECCPFLATEKTELQVAFGWTNLTPQVSHH